MGAGSEGLWLVLESRCSVRWFEDKPVEEEKISRILRAAILAPNAMGLEQWFFIVARSLEARRKVYEAIKEGLRTYYCARSLEAKIPKLEKAFEEGLLWAPVYIGCYLDLRERGFNESMQWFEEEMGVQTISAAIENMMLAAAEEGLGTCWLGVARLVPWLFDEAFQPPRGCRIVAAVAVGYPRGEVKAKPRRKSLEEVTKWI